MNKKLIRLTEGDLHRIVKESVKYVLYESWTKLNGDLKNHLKNIHRMDEKTLLWLADIYPEFYADYLGAVNSELYDEYAWDLSDIIENLTDYNMSYFIKEKSLPIDERFGYFVKKRIMSHPSYYSQKTAKWVNKLNVIPDAITLGYRKPFLNKPLVHYCFEDGDAENILNNGFKYGAELKNLAWTFGYKNEKGNYGFAYKLNDVINDTQHRLSNYGREGVVFIGSGVEVNHYGDTRDDMPVPECIFDKDSVKEMICRFKLSFKCFEVYDKNNKLIYKSKNVNREGLFTWISNNLIKW
jgi:hypothetical protein